jgi:hypothetical protein
MRRQAAVWGCLADFLRILYELLMGPPLRLDEKGIMLTLVEIGTSGRTSSPESAALVADYMAFDRRRTSRRQYQKAFGGLALVVAIGALFGRVAAGEAEIVTGLLLVPPVCLAIIEVVDWRRLIRRLDMVREEARTVKKS